GQMHLVLVTLLQAGDSPIGVGVRIVTVADVGHQLAVAEAGDGDPVGRGIHCTGIEGLRRNAADGVGRSGIHLGVIEIDAQRLRQLNRMRAGINDVNIVGVAVRQTADGSSIGRRVVDDRFVFVKAQARQTDGIAGGAYAGVVEQYLRAAKGVYRAIDLGPNIRLVNRHADTKPYRAIPVNGRLCPIEVRNLAVGVDIDGAML